MTWVSVNSRSPCRQTWAMRQRAGHLAVNPHAAVSFWWPQQGRQIRIRGQAVPAGGQASAAGGGGPGSCSGPDPLPLFRYVVSL